MSRDTTRRRGLVVGVAFEPLRLRRRADVAHPDEPRESAGENRASIRSRLAPAGPGSCRCPPIVRPGTRAGRGTGGGGGAGWACVGAVTQEAASNAAAIRRIGPPVRMTDEPPRRRQARRSQAPPGMGSDPVTTHGLRPPRPVGQLEARTSSSGSRPRRQRDRSDRRAASASSPRPRARSPAGSGRSASSTPIAKPGPPS